MSGEYEVVVSAVLADLRHALARVEATAHGKKSVAAKVLRPAIKRIEAMIRRIQSAETDSHAD